MPSSSKRQQAFFSAVKNAKHNPNYGNSHLHKVADSMTDSDIDNFTKLKAELKIKKAILSVLKDCREPMYLQEGESDVIVKEFNVEGKFEEYAKRFLGQRLSEKEMEAFNTYQDKKPTKIESNQVRYETTDEFKNSTTTVIKKLREGAEFVFVAFTKYSKTEKPQSDQLNQPSGLSGHADLSGMNAAPPMFEHLDGNKFKLNELAPTPTLGGTDPLADLQQPPTGTPTPTNVGPMTTTAPMTGTPKSSDQKKKEMGIDDILIRKSSTFKDEIKGGAILAEFLKKLNL